MAIKNLGQAYTSMPWDTLPNGNKNFTNAFTYEPLKQWTDTQGVAQNLYNDGDASGALGPAFGTWKAQQDANKEAFDNNPMSNYGLGENQIGLYGGWKPTLVTPSMVGSTVAVFVSIECKRPGWHIIPSDRRAHAQAKWLELVARAGGIALFATGVGALP